MTFSLPPVVRLAERMLVEVETAVTRFPRRHKYLFGSDLRKAAMRVAVRAQRAWRDRANQARRVEKLVRAVDELKICLQLGSRIRAFASFNQFEALARLASDLGRQAGGWHRQQQQQQQQHPKGQNCVASTAVVERAQTLSTCSASRSTGATP